MTAERRERVPHLGPVGAWVPTFVLAPTADARPAIREIERLGYPSIWYPEGLGTRESFVNASILLHATERIVVATGITNVWGRDAVTAATATRTLDDAFPGRFLLGLGVSHPRQVDPRGHTYVKPVAKMRAYLAELDVDPQVSPDGEAVPRPPVPRIVAALRPPMLRVAADLADGAHTFLGTVEHTRRAAAILGPDKVLAVEIKAVLHPDRAEARRRARAAAAWYLDTPNYRDHLTALGYTEQDLAGGGSDRLVDDLVAAGDVDTVVQHVRAHQAAGATHVAIQPLGDDDDPFGLKILAELAPEVLR